MLKRVWRKGNPATPLVGIYSGTAITENIMEVPWKTTEQTYDLAIPLQAVCLEKTIIRKYAGILIFIAALFTIVKI